jgi:shikimate kinase
LKGEAVACGGVSVLNAIATGGFGGAVQVSLCLRAEARLGGVRRGVSVTPWGRMEVPPRLLAAVERRLGVRGLEVRVESLIPPASGLKSSSALAAAVALAGMRAAGMDPEPLEAARLAVAASREAGLTVTGALDDHVASLAPGVHVTYNLAGEGVLVYTVDAGGCVPVVLGFRGERRVSEAPQAAYSALRPLYALAASAALRGDWLSAMRLNGLLTAVADGAAGEVLDAYRAGALAAGVTGKGPTLFALARDPEPVAEAWASRGLRVSVAVARMGGGCGGGAW